MIAVVDTGPLVYLAQLNRLTLLRDLYKPHAPSNVLDEIGVWSNEARHLVQKLPTAHHLISKNRAYPKFIQNPIWDIFSKTIPTFQGEI